MKLIPPAPTRLFSALTACLTLGIGGTAHAAFLLVQDFDAGTVGAANGQLGITTDNATVDLVASGDGLALNSGNQFTEAFFSIPTIADGTVATVFFQLQTSSLSAGVSLGVADASINSDAGPSDPSTFNSFRAQIALSGNGSFTLVGNQTGNSDQSDSFVVSPGPIATNDLVNVYMVVDNLNDTYQVYITDDEAATAVTPLSGTFSGTTTSDIPFRGEEPGNVDLTNFLFARGGGSTNNAVTIDNLYIDTTGVNLSNPILIPEPASLALLGMGALCMGSRRRRR